MTNVQYSIKNTPYYENTATSSTACNTARRPGPGSRHRSRRTGGFRGVFPQQRAGRRNAGGPPRQKQTRQRAPRRRATGLRVHGRHAQPGAQHRRVQRTRRRALLALPHPRRRHRARAHGPARAASAPARQRRTQRTQPPRRRQPPANGYRPRTARFRGAALAGGALFRASGSRQRYRLVRSARLRRRRSVYPAGRASIVGME